MTYLASDKPKVRQSKALLSGAIATVLTSATSPTIADVFLTPPAGDSIIGDMRVVQSRYKDTLLDIARRYNLGNNEIRSANPKVDMWIPGEGTKILLPTRFILPNAPRTGVVINIAEPRIYYYTGFGGNDTPMVHTFPISIGREGWETPLGTTTITTKIKDPSWTPPASIKKEHMEKGDILPDVVPAGPENPLGAYAMRLGIPGYLIHGTNKPYSIGMRVSHGCVRMYPEDIESLFKTVPSGTKVNIVNQPYKTAWKDGVLMLEAHPHFVGAETSTSNDRQELHEVLQRALKENPGYVINWKLADKIATEARGIPIPVPPSRT